MIVQLFITLLPCNLSQSVEILSKIKSYLVIADPDAAIKQKEAHNMINERLAFWMVVGGAQSLKMNIRHV